MSVKKTNTVYIIGHRNPDTDSICSAIAYANLKTKTDDSKLYEARRAGELNGETAYVLEKFGVKTPRFLHDVRQQIRDVNIREMKGIDVDLSIKDAWEIMKKENMSTLPVLSDKKLDGIITSGDIARSYMECYEDNTLAVAHTTYKNIAKTLNGEIVTGNVDGCFHDGKVIVGAASPDMMEELIDKGDLVILGNRYDNQLCAIEMDAACLVICQGAKASITIKKLASQRDIVIIESPLDTFAVSRLINQSIPVKHVMTKDDALKGYHLYDYIADVKDEMSNLKYRDFPVVDKEGDFVGFVSRRRVLSAKKKQVILVDHNERAQAVEGLGEAEILEVIDHHRLGGLKTIEPLYFRNQPVGCTATIVYTMYLEQNVEIDPATAGILASAIISDTLLFRSPTCTAFDKMAAEALAKIAGIDLAEHAKKMFQAGSNLKGKTESEICYMDFKVFTSEKLRMGIGQISAMGEEELQEVKGRLMAYLETAKAEQNVDMIFMMLTNILDESSEVLCCGKNASSILAGAFDVEEASDAVVLPGVISRKKQMVPKIMEYLQQK